MAFPSMNSSDSVNTRSLIRWAIVIGYFVVTFVGASWFGGYISRVGGIGNVPDAIYLVFGPIIALSHGHGIPIYIFATVAVLPLLLVAVGLTIFPRLLFFAAAVVVWVAVG